MLKAATRQTGSAPGIFRRSRRQRRLDATRASSGHQAIGAVGSGGPGGSSGSVGPGWPGGSSGLGGLIRGLGALALGCLIAAGCGEQEPHYLPPLPDLSSGPAATPGLPCEVSKLLASRCLVCHGQPPAAAPIALASYADLTGMSLVDSKKSVAERAILRMLDGMDPMPPGPAVTVAQSELVPMQMWVAAGAPMVTCKAQ